MALLLAVVLDCKPVELLPFTAQGHTKRGLKVEVTKKGVTVRVGQSVLWSTEGHAFAVMISEEDQWVALKGPYPTGSITIAPATVGAKPVTVDPLAHLTPDERQRVPVTSCGVSWFKGWRNAPRVLLLEVEQGEAPAVMLQVKPDGTVSR